MTDLAVTKHARKRLAQRSMGQIDIDLILRIGTEVEGGLLVRRKDFEAFAVSMQATVEHARRLVGKRVVIADGHLVTAYHATRSDERKLLRSS